ncbi:MAG: hypothetical protein AAF456_21070 [Planctomycetota bacterium]
MRESGIKNWMIAAAVVIVSAMATDAEAQTCQSGGGYYPAVANQHYGQNYGYYGGGYSVPSYGYGTYQPYYNYGYYGNNHRYGSAYPSYGTWNHRRNGHQQQHNSNRHRQDDRR